MGDPDGIGPEIVAKVAAEGRAKDLLVVGSANLLERTARRLKLKRSAVDVAHVAIDDADGGVGFVAVAHQLAMEGKVRAIVTGPIGKLAPTAEGGPAPGHTELLSHWAGVKPAATMLMVSPRLKISLVTNHLALADVPRAITRAAVLLAIRRTHDALRGGFGVRRPRLLVLGLNPHAGEGGKLGDEERKAIAPAVAAARKAGIDAVGPLPADSSLHYARVASRYDAVVAMYHDQGLIPAKLEGFGDAVNVSLGLPYVRTSVDHGTAYDIAGKGIADPSSLRAAIALARVLTVRNT